MTTQEGFFTEGEVVFKITRSGDTKRVGTFFEIILNEPLGIAGWSKDEIIAELGELFPDKVKRWHNALQAAFAFGGAVLDYVWDNRQHKYTCICEEKIVNVSSTKRAKIYNEEEKSEYSRLLQYSEETAGYFLDGAGKWADVEFLTPSSGFLQKIEADGNVVAEWFGFHKLAAKTTSAGAMPHGDHVWAVGDVIHAEGRKAGKATPILAEGTYIL